MLRNMNISNSGKRDSSSPFVGVLANEVPSGFPMEAFLLNDLDQFTPNRRYSFEILTLPSAGELRLNKAGVGSFKDAPSGTYTGTQRVEKFDPATGRVSSITGPYSLQIGSLPPKVESVVVTPNYATGAQQFTAEVKGQNSPPQTVTWSKVGNGTLSDTGYFEPPEPTTLVQSIEIKATSTLDPTIFGISTVIIAPILTHIDPVVTGITLNPRNPVIIGGTKFQFTHSVLGNNNPSQLVDYEVDIGEITDLGELTAPVATPEIQTGTVTVTSRANPEFSTSTNFTVPIAVIETEDPDAPKVLGVTVNPTGLFLLGSSSQQFSAVAYGTGNINQEFIWTSDKAIISQSGVAVMPIAIFGEQVVTITATSKQDPTISGSVTVTVQSLGEIDPDSIILPSSRILRTSAEDWKIRIGYNHKDGDTFYLSQGVWVIDKDGDDILYYALDLVPYLESIGASISNVIGLAEGVSLLTGPFLRDSLIIVKIGGGNRSDNADAINSLTLRIKCSNGESIDKSIYFVMKEN